MEADELFDLSQMNEEDLGRREFFSIMAASLAFASLAGCTSAPPEKIVPYVQTPENLLPGKPVVFATSMPTPGGGLGLLVESHEGRPIKIEGNPDHPASLGATDAFAQASLLTLYDPDRAQTISYAGNISTWDALITALQQPMTRFQSNGGAGLRLLTEGITSPTLADLVSQLLAKYPGAAWHQYEPVHRDNSRSAGSARYNFEEADVIVSLDSDFLSWEPGHLHYARKFTARRKVASGEMSMNRLYMVESAMTITGAMADHRYAVRSSDIPAIAKAIANGGAEPSWVATLIQDLEAHRGRSIVIAGEIQPPEVHAIVRALNDRLGNVGKTVVYGEPAQYRPEPNLDSLARLTKDMAAGKVDTLIMIGVNPAYTAPADLDFARHLANVPLRVHQSLYFDETSERSHWHVPETHYLEGWGDTRAWDGTASIMQPLIVPLYQTRTATELLTALLGNPSLSNYEIVRAYWQKQRPGTAFEEFWSESVRAGVIAEPATPAATKVAVLPASVEGTPASQGDANSIEVVFRPDPTIYDGRWANNSWLQELPKPVTKLTWDNAALMSASTASRLGVQNSDVITIDNGGRIIHAPVLVASGHADNSVTLTLGYGRRRSGRVGMGRGFDAYAIRTSTTSWIIPNATIRKTNERYVLATTQSHHELNGRHIARGATAQEYGKNPELVHEMLEVPGEGLTFFPAVPENIDYSWGMAIDLSTCIGCNACVVACQAENNVPVVGKKEVTNGREMQWMRIDTYNGDESANAVQMYFQPMMCQHCETAPCEVVCPVEATSHSAEGLNEMTYNRCVGTRYCSNNCPYKVRRFNFFQYANWDVPQLKLLYNPDVTVRTRGVMEKCTYCVQRINRARIHAKLEDREIRDGEIVTACQSACPANAIMFGNLKDQASQVSKWKAEPRNYGVLAELNTKPRTTYLAKLTNPNPALL